jgi:hypothetical protein
MADETAGSKIFFNPLFFFHLISHELI